MTLSFKLLRCSSGTIVKNSFHNVSGEEAEALLIKYGVKGAFEPQRDYKKVIFFTRAML